jgi:hypothetical protein
MVQIHGHLDSAASAFLPSATIRTSFLGSNPSIPETGQLLEQIPQVKQIS